MSEKWIAQFFEIDEREYFDTKEEAEACVADTRTAYEELLLTREHAAFPPFQAAVITETQWRAARIAGVRP